MASIKYQTCWTLTDGSAGMFSQVLGLAKAVGCGNLLEKTAKQQPPWLWLPPQFAGSHLLNKLVPSSDQLIPPWPDLLVSCGRRSVPLALAIRKASQGKTYCVHIQNPRINPRYFDLVVAPAHDELTGKNVVQTLGAVHPITSANLQQAEQDFGQRFAGCPLPWMAVMIGGDSNRYRFSSEAAIALGDKLQAVLDNNPGSLLVTPSRRTSAERFNQVIGRLTDPKRVFVADDIQNDNPYFGMLALAQVLMVTEDSVSMLSEACATGKPVYILPLQGHPPSKARRFADFLVDKGMARWLTKSIDTWSYPAFNDTETVANTIRQALENR